jgi:hypothetical protein
MKVIVVQSISQALEMIEKKIREVFPLLDNVIYESNFEKTLQIIPTEEEIVVITSDMFHDDKDELFERQEKDGSKLAEEIKKINPKAKVYVFSTYEPRPEYIDGFYHKIQGGDNTGNEIIKIFMDLKLY